MIKGKGIRSVVRRQKVFYVHTRSRPAQVYETSRIEKDQYGVSFRQATPYGMPSSKIQIPWANVDHIQEIDDEELADYMANKVNHVMRAV